MDSAKAIGKRYRSYIDLFNPQGQTILSQAFSLLICLRVTLTQAAFSEALTDCLLGTVQHFHSTSAAADYRDNFHNPIVVQMTTLYEIDDHVHPFFVLSEDKVQLSEPVKEYLRTLVPYQSRSNNAIIAAGCLQCLTSEATLNHDSGRTPFRNLWHEYSALYWADHLSASQDLRQNACLQSLCEEFIPHDIAATPAFAAWSTAAESAVNENGQARLQGWQADVESILALPPDSILAAVAWNLNDIVAARLDVDPVAAKTKGFGFSNPLIHTAAEFGNTEAIPMLLNRGVDIEERDGFHDTAVMSATGRNKVETVELLLMSGALAEVVNDHGPLLTPLQVAAKEGYTEIVQMLLGFGADPRAVTLGGLTPLELAVKYGHEETAKILLGRFPENFPSKSDACLVAARLQRALYEGAFLDLRVELEAWSRSPSSNYDLHVALWTAVRQNRLDAVELLIGKGVKMDIVHKGRSLLWAAAQEQEKPENSSPDLAMVKLLLSHGADPNSSSPDRHAGLLLCQAAYEGHMKLVRLLVDYGANVRLAAEQGPTPLYQAIFGEEIAVAQFLLEQGADVNEIGHPPPRRGRYRGEANTLLDVAVEEESVEIAALLRRYGGKRMRACDEESGQDASNTLQSSSSI